NDIGGGDLASIGRAVKITGNEPKELIAKLLISIGVELAAIVTRERSCRNYLHVRKFILKIPLCFADIGSKACRASWPHLHYIYFSDVRIIFFPGVIKVMKIRIVIR